MYHICEPNKYKTYYLHVPFAVKKIKTYHTLYLKEISVPK